MSAIGEILRTLDLDLEIAACKMLNVDVVCRGRPGGKDHTSCSRQNQVSP